MRRIVGIVMLMMLLAGSAAAQFAPPDTVEQTAYGRLTVYSDVDGSDIYVDAKFVGQDRATISNIPIGKHYVRVVKGDETIQSGIVSVTEGEETIIVAKPTGDNLEESRRKPNRVLFFAGYSDLGYEEALPGTTYSYNYKPQYGFGAEVEFPVPLWDLRIDMGFFQNYPGGIAVSATQEAHMAISTPYLNISKSIIKTPALKINGGVGINYGIFSPGYRTQITISSKLGYQAFLEAELSSGQHEVYLVRAGYISYSGESAAPGTVTSAGYYLQGGVAYQL
ncbi:PEGA domain-containing protein [Candidatus Margulisiibacteriota bacterium]